MTKDEALHLALASLESWSTNLQDYVEDLDRQAIAAVKAALEAKDEPVAWMVYTQEGQSAFVTDNPAVIHPSQRALPLYATPQRTWVGLTDEEMQAVVDAQPLVSNINVYFKAIEAKLKEKNT